MKKTIATLLAGMLTVSCGVGVVSAEETVFDNHSNENFSLVSWADTYNSVDDMIDNADATIVGTVIGQSVEQRGNNDLTLYFTHSYVESYSGEVYDVLQTGAYVNGVAKNVPNDVSLLEIDKKYFLSLNQTAYDDEYGQYKRIYRPSSDDLNNLRLKYQFIIN